MYNAANQLISDGTNTLTYDNNGNLTSDGVNSYVWDRANRLLSMGGASYQYDGEGRRTQQTVSSVVTKYLLDTQPGLSVVLSQDVGGDVTRFVHAPRGIHARQDATNDWHWTVQDGLGTVRIETDNSAGVEDSQNLDPFGNLIDLNGTIGTPYGFTGEMVDGSGLLDLRTRRYNAGLGTFASLDPFEGMRDRAMSLNGYLYVEGNVPNAVDPTGMSRMLAALLSGGGCFPNDMPPTDIEDECLKRCTDWGCLSTCELSRPLEFDKVIKDATVMIAFRGDEVGDVNPNANRCASLKPPAVTGLGTITPQGVWTHDHMTHSGQNWNSPQSHHVFGEDATSPVEAAEFMKSWPCVQFTGSLGSSIIKGQDLRINSNVRGGTLFIDDNQIAADGSSVNLSSLGKAAFTYSNWSSHNEFQYRVKVAYVIGENVGHNEKWLDHSNVDVFDMLVDLSVGEQSYLGRMAYVTTWNLQFGDVIQPGDSGGGVFYNDRLIGVTLAAHSSEGPISINGSYFVSLNGK